MAATSKMTELVQKERAKKVEMNECKILLYRKSHGIVTGDLGSCHVVVLQSPIAVLLTHISPRPGLGQASQATGDQHVARKMTEALELYMRWRSWFPSGSSAWGVYAWYNKSVALGDQKRIIEQKLAPTGLPIHDRYYTVPMTNDRPGRGTVVSGWMDGDATCRLYVEDKLQNEIVVQEKHLQLASVLAKAMNKTSEASNSQPSTAPTTSSRGAQSADEDAPTTPTTGAAAGNAAMAILGRFGIDPFRARIILQNALRDVQQQVPALSRDNDKAAVAAACRAVIERSPRKMELENAKDLLRREMSAQSSRESNVAGPSAPRRQVPSEDSSSDDDD